MDDPDIHHDHSDALRIPKVMYMVSAKGKPPGEPRAKTWCRIFTKASAGEPLVQLWTNHASLAVTVWSTQVDWVEDQ